MSDILRHRIILVDTDQFIGQLLLLQDLFEITGSFTFEMAKNEYGFHSKTSNKSK